MGWQTKKECNNCYKFDICNIKQKGIKYCSDYMGIPRMPQIAQPKLRIIEIDIVALTEQLNGLIKSYMDVYSMYDQLKFINTEEVNATRAEIKEVLDNINQAIKGICCRISKREIIIHGNSEIKE
mgnify:CR=1 FL=1